MRGAVLAPEHGIGNFDALYEPKSGVLTITVKCKFWFVDGEQSAWEDVEPSELLWDPGSILKWKADFTRKVCRPSTIRSRPRSP